MAGPSCPLCEVSKSDCQELTLVRMAEESQDWGSWVGVKSFGGFCVEGTTETVWHDYV